MNAATALERGLSPFPVQANKRPYWSWKEYQNRHPTPEEIQSWEQYLAPAWAFATGPISNRVVLDFDGPEGVKTMERLGLKPHRKTGSGGYHVDLEHPGWPVATVNGKTKRDLGRLYPGLDIRADGGYVVFQGRNEAGPYEWLRDPEPDPLDVLPIDLRKLLGLDKPPEKHPQATNPAPPKGNGELVRYLIDRAVSMAPADGRNNAGFALACQIRDNGCSQDKAESAMREYVYRVPETNTKGNREPYTEQEAMASVREAYRRPARDPWSDRQDAETLKPVPASQPLDLEFPNVMSGLAGDFAELYSSYLEAPKQFFYFAFLTCLGSLLSGKLTLDMELDPQPRLYTLLLGESADDRKSTVLKKTIGFFQDAVGDFATCFGAGSAEGLQKILKENTNLLLCYDEFRAFVSKCKAESSVLLPCVNTLFENNEYENQTKTTSVNVRDAHLSVLAASTVQTYETTWDASFSDIGLNNRLFVVVGEGKRRFPFPPKIPRNEIDGLAHRLKGILFSAGAAPELALEPPALDLYSHWYLNQEKSVHAKRLDVYAMRLMALLAVNDGKRTVDEETIRIVLSLVNWQLSVRKVYAPIDADGKVARMEEKIRRQLRKQPAKEWKLKQMVNANREGIWVFTSAKDNLIRAKELRWNRQDKTFELIEDH